MINPLISVIVPCYKVENYLSKCIKSIINQTYSNLEIFLVDDGSPDNTGKICEEYAIQDKRIKVIHKENGGLSDARNVAIDIATGEYILFIDSDDYVSPNHIEHLFEMITKAKADIAIEWLQPFYEGTEPIIDSLNGKKEFIVNADDALINMFYQKDFDTNACAKLYKHNLFDNVRYPKGWLYEDLPTTYKLILKSKKIIYSNYKSYYYLLRKNSIEGMPFKPLKYESCIKIINQLEKDRNNMNPKVQKALDCRVASFAFHLLLEIPKKEAEKRQELMKIIRAKRTKVIMDSKARMKTRIACFLTFGGQNLIDRLASYGKSRQN